MTNEPESPHPCIASDLLEDATVFRILIDRPKGNILTIELIRELSHLISEAEGPRLRLIVLQGAGGHFSYGTSIEQHREQEAPDLLASFHRLVRQLAACPTPVAALVEGNCFGGGFELVLCCHFVFAQSNARFACPEIKLGVFPPVLAAIGAMRLGGPVAERMLLAGTSLDAVQAHHAGLITEILPDGRNPEEALMEWYRRHLRPLSAFALKQASRAGRAALIEALGEPLARIERLYISTMLSSHDGKEGIEAFLARRDPVWKEQ